MSAPLLPGESGEALPRLLGPFLARQEWAQSVLGLLGEASVPVRLLDLELLSEGRPGLMSAVVEASGARTCRLHVVVGWRGVEAITGTPLRPGAVIGAGRDEEGEVVLYDALADHELSLRLLSVATGGAEQASRCRTVQSLVSHAALVFDERLFMKCYRVLEARPRPEIETMLALDRVGFNHLLAPVARWTRASGDLALVREFLPGAVEGKALALASLRDLLARAGSGQELPSFNELGRTGGDLSDEMRRLGETTALMHVALAEAFGTGEPLAGGGRQVRVHGDYHLRRVMRFDAGWLVAGFGDDPLLGEQAGWASQQDATRALPLQDVADLFVSLAQVAAEAVELQPPGVLAHSRQLAAGWVRHNADAFLSGYLATPGIAELVPPGREEVESWLRERVPGRLESLGLARLSS